jgi:hypothetical protein
VLDSGYKNKRIEDILRSSCYVLETKGKALCQNSDNSSFAGLYCKKRRQNGVFLACKPGVFMD